LGIGFDRLEQVLNDTEEQISSWGGNNRPWVIAGAIGLILGSLAGTARWILLGMSLQRAEIGVLAMMAVQKISLRLAVVMLGCTAIGAGIYLIFRTFRRQKLAYPHADMDFKSENLANRYTFWDEHNVPGGLVNSKGRYSGLCL
jgi:hypothetical protein